MIHFDEVKSRAIECITKQKTGTAQYYIIRDVFGKIAVYVMGETDAKIERLKQALTGAIGEKWLGQVISLTEDSILYPEICNSTIELENSIFFGERPLVKKSWSRTKTDKRRGTAKVITFYSYKGGVGRTTTLALTALQMARAGKRVVTVDFDLEAPGLATVLRPEGAYPEYGLIDFLVEYDKQENNLDIREYIYPVTSKKLLGLKGGEVFVMQAANLERGTYDAYFYKLSRLDFNLPKYSQKDGAIDCLLDEIDREYHPDVIMVDARAGVHDIGGLTLFHYSDEAVAVFYGNAQNMAGLTFALPKLKQAEIPFYLLNSPVPVHEEEAKEETELYAKTSLEILEKENYFEDTPDLFDESSAHFPMNITYDPLLTNLNSLNKLHYVLGLYGEENPYKLLADQMLSDENPTYTGQSVFCGVDKKPLLKTIERIKPQNTGAAEVEFHNLEELKKNFYPLQEYRYIFDNSKFLITGAKGSGKTALFLMLQCPAYVQKLANYLGVSADEAKNTDWVVGIAYTNQFPAPAQLDRVGEYDDKVIYAAYWKVLLIRVLQPTIEKFQIEIGALAKELFALTFGQIPDWIQQHQNINAVLFEDLQKIDANLQEQGKQVIVIYDQLDRLLNVDYRGKLISALINLWMDNMVYLKNIHTKIFLRKDIFQYEVHDLTDKIKLNNYRTTIEWNYDYLLAMIWKRLMEHSDTLKRKITESLAKDGYAIFADQEIGIIPRPAQEINQSILKALIGEKMGKGNKGYTYNWIAKRLQDVQGRIVPRSMLKLFSEAAIEEQKRDPNQDDAKLIHPVSLQKAILAVSEDYVTDVKEEYPQYKIFFEELKHHCLTFPAYEETFVAGLEQCGIQKENIGNSIDELKEIGVLKEYPRKKSDPLRYHIPDIFLKGMGLVRKGS